MTWGDLDPYKTLELGETTTPLEIKRSYKQLSLKFHPDKNKEIDTDVFARVQYAYLVLSDPVRRKRYDATGSLADHDDDDDFDWLDFFKNTQEKITVEMIDEDRKKYQGSEEEKVDITTNFAYYEGDFLKLFEVIPHLEFTEEEEARVFAIVDGEIDKMELAKEVKSLWDKYKKLRKTKVQRMLKKLAKEAKEAEALKAKMNAQGDLKLLIQSRGKQRSELFLARLEAKYAMPAKKGKKRTAEPSDEEFARIQQKMKKRV